MIQEHIELAHALINRSNIAVNMICSKLQASFKTSRIKAAMAKHTVSVQHRRMQLSMQCKLQLLQDMKHPYLHNAFFPTIPALQIVPVKKTRIGRLIKEGNELADTEEHRLLIFTSRVGRCQNRYLP